MKRYDLLLISAAAAVLVSCATSRDTGGSGTLELFNGRDLTGWKSTLADATVDPASVWSVRDGILICKGEPMGYLASERTFTNYRFEVDYRWAPGQTPGNSGLFGRINGAPRPLPRCLEIQLKEGNAGDVLGLQGMKVTGDADRFKFVANHEVAGDINIVGRMTGNEKPAGEWNRVEVVVNGGEVTVTFNGQLVNQATGAEVLAGPVGLQSEGGEIHFRRVQLTSLD
ncbi:MAG: 3-keto-disaccharide hydrolase [Limisphaerales bacterium]